MNYSAAANITTTNTMNICNKNYLKIRLPEKACLISANFPTVSLSIKEKKCGLVFFTYVPFVYDTIDFQHMVVLAQSLGWVNLNKIRDTNHH